MIKYADPKDHGIAVMLYFKNIGRMTALVKSYKLVPEIVDMKASLNDSIRCDQGMAQTPQRVGDMPFELPDATNAEIDSYSQWLKTTVERKG